MEIKKKVLNLWYYYKFHLVVAVLAIAVIAIGINSCLKKTDYDVNLIYITHGYTDVFYQSPELVSLFDKYAEDVNNDGKHNVQLMTINYGTTAADYSNASATRAAYLASGKSVLLLIDKQNYDELKNGGFLADISGLGQSEYLQNDRFEIFRSGMLDAVPGFKAIGDEYYLCIRTYDEQKAKKDDKYKRQYESAILIMKNIISSAN